LFDTCTVVQYFIGMDTRGKLQTLAEAAQFDLSCACGGPQKRTLGNDGLWIYPAALPDGQTMPVLKVLQSSGCERNCTYCAQRNGGKGPRICFSPDDLAREFMKMVRARMVGGLFLSSAIMGSPIATMDRMLATVERVRFKHRFFGYVHLKIIPGAQEAQIIRAMEIANRVSVNLEAPNEERLAAIAPGKSFHDQLKGTMRFIGDNLGREGLRCKSQTTQFVVGAAGEQDKETISTLWESYEEANLARGYFSAFQPVTGTPLEGAAPVPAMREHRLYQVDFLFRKYEFEIDDIIFDDEENLSLAEDPKMMWAGRHPEVFPMEVNDIERRELLRVPGLGPMSVDRILERRRISRICELDVLKRITPRWRTAAPYLLFDGKRRDRHMAQLELF